MAREPSYHLIVNSRERNSSLVLILGESSLIQIASSVNRTIDPLCVDARISVSSNFSRLSSLPNSDSHFTRCCVSLQRLGVDVLGSVIADAGWFVQHNRPDSLDMKVCIQLHFAALFQLEV